MTKVSVAESNSAVQSVALDWDRADEFIRRIDIDELHERGVAADAVKLLRDGNKDQAPRAPSRLQV